MKPTKVNPGQILIPRQTLIQDDPRLTGMEKQALLVQVGVIQTSEVMLARKNPRMKWSVCQSNAGWYGQSSEDKETIQTDLFDAHAHLRGFAQVDWFNEKETPEFRLYTRIDPHAPRKEDGASATDRQTGAVIKTMPLATEVRPGLGEFFHQLGIWYSDCLYVQASIDLMQWLDENYPLWKDPLAYWD
jgi:hypothetical protein